MPNPYNDLCGVNFIQNIFWQFIHLGVVIVFFKSNPYLLYINSSW